MSLIPCPECGRPLLLGAERRGRWRVSYRHLYLRPNRAALLVCPGLACDYREDVHIAAGPDDAIRFSTGGAANLWSIQERSFALTLGGIEERLQQLSELYSQNGNPKFPSAYRYWREQGNFRYWSIWHALQRQLKSKEEAVLSGDGLNERGRVMEVRKRSVLLERSQDGTRVSIPFTEINHAAGVWKSTPRIRFDFSDGTDALRNGNGVMHTPTRFIMVNGQRVALDSVTRYGLCRVRSYDAAVAGALHLRPYFADTFYGEIPVFLVERAFKTITHCYIAGHRLHFQSLTKDPEIVQVGSRDMATAQALRMHRDGMHWIGRRRQLQWWRFVNRSEIERFEEKQIPLDLQSLIQEAAHR